LRTALTLLLTLLLSHLPVPFPDLDGECGGARIHSLAECHVWHVLMLGVVPHDDIEYGPIRSNDPDDQTPVDSPFGDSAMLHSMSVIGATSIADHGGECLDAVTRLFEQPVVAQSVPQFSSGSAARVSAPVTPGTLRV
jgi:hypothetical protein